MILKNVSQNSWAKFGRICPQEIIWFERGGLSMHYLELANWKPMKILIGFQLVIPLV